MDVAIGISDFEGEPSGTMQFEIKKEFSGESQIRFTITSEYSKWKEFKLNFLVTSREDIEVGQFYYEPSSGS